MMYSATTSSARNIFLKSSSHCSDIFKAEEYFRATVLQSLVIKKLHADLQLQAYFAISHSCSTNADYSPRSDCSAAQPRR